MLLMPQSHPHRRSTDAGMIAQLLGEVARCDMKARSAANPTLANLWMGRAEALRTRADIAAKLCPT